MSLVFQTSLIFTKTVRGFPMTGFSGSKLYISQIYVETSFSLNSLNRSGPVSPEQVRIIEYHWITDVSIDYVQVHHYQC